jgi:uncharacterized membrane protein YfcA
MVLVGAIAASIVVDQRYTASAWVFGYVDWKAALIIGLPSLVGVPIGVYLAHYLPVRHLKRIFGVILFVIAWEMLPK